MILFFNFIFFQTFFQLACAQTNTAQSLPDGLRDHIRVVTLKQALDLALQNNLDFKSQSEVLNQAQARKDMADSASFPKISATSILSPIYKEEGNAIDTNSDLSKWGVWVQSIVTIVQPIYTWGRITSLKNAAEKGIAVAEAQVQKNTNELYFEVKQLYYSCVLAEQLFKFIEDARNKINEVHEKATKRNSKINKRDLFRLELFKADVETKYLEANKLRTLARHALSLKLGLNPQSPTLPFETMLDPIVAEAPKFEEMEKILLENRPELKQLSQGILAKQSLLDVEKKSILPQFFVGGMLSFAYSNMRTAQNSAYANDPYNRNTGGFGLGLQWNWDLATSFANQSLISSEINELEKKQDYAEQGLRLELRKNLLELEQAEKTMQACKTAFETGRKWLNYESTNYSLDSSKGGRNLKDLGDSFLARAKTAKEYWESIYKLNMAWAELSKTTGKQIETIH